MTGLFENLKRFRRCSLGQVAVEYTLVLGVFGIPMIWLSRILLEMLIEYYRLLTFFETLPFP